MEILSNRLKELRKQKEINQKEIADFLGINRVTYTGYETNKHEPSLEILLKIASFYKVSVDYLMGRYE